VAAFFLFLDIFTCELSAPHPQTNLVFPRPQAPSLFPSSLRLRTQGVRRCPFISSVIHVVPSPALLFSLVFFSDIVVRPPFFSVLRVSPRALFLLFLSLYIVEMFQRMHGRVGVNMLTSALRLQQRTFAASGLYSSSSRCALPCHKRNTPLFRPYASAVATCASTAALQNALRGYTTSTRTQLMRVQGRDDVQSVNSPMNWSGNGGSSGGSQADSLTPYVRQHLARVYTLLGCACLTAGLGSFLMVATPMGRAIPYWFPMLGGFVPLLWLSFAPPANPSLKLGLFFSFALLEGMGLAPLVLATSMKGVLTTSILLTAAVFGGFSAAAYLAPRASMVAWQGPLYGALIGMVAISVLNIFYPTAIAHSIILYGGLALFSIMVAADTQAMIERARCGAGDHVQDAMQMFLNVINIFVRIAQIMGSMDR
jgi:Bax inhibitor 1